MTGGLDEKGGPRSRVVGGPNRHDPMTNLSRDGDGLTKGSPHNLRISLRPFQGEKKKRKAGSKGGRPVERCLIGTGALGGKGGGKK